MTTGKGARRGHSTTTPAGVPSMVARRRHADVPDVVNLLVRLCSIYVALVWSPATAARRGVIPARGEYTRDQRPTSDWGEFFSWYYGMGV